jgi:hypothetical protein
MSWRGQAEGAMPPQRSSEPTNLREDIVDELADHLALAAERERDASGFSKETVWARVLKRFGGPSAIARRLWWDAMGETVMREWTQTSAIVVGVVAVLLFVALGFKQMQATNLAVLEALQRQSNDANEHFSTIDISIHRGTADGPPAEGMEVAMSGHWFEDNQVTVREETDSNDGLSLWPIRQGRFHLEVTDPNSGLVSQRPTVLLGGHKDIFIVAPFAETTPVDWGLPPYADDEHQLVDVELNLE